MLYWPIFQMSITEELMISRYVWETCFSPQNSDGFRLTCNSPRVHHEFRVSCIFITQHLAESTVNWWTAPLGRNMIWNANSGVVAFVSGNSLMNDLYNVTWSPSMGEKRRNRIDATADHLCKIECLVLLRLGQDDGLGPHGVPRGIHNSPLLVP